MKLQLQKMYLSYDNVYQNVFFFHKLTILYVLTENDSQECACEWPVTELKANKHLLTQQYRFYDLKSQFDHYFSCVVKACSMFSLQYCVLQKQHATMQVPFHFKWENPTLSQTSSN